MSADLLEVVGKSLYGQQWQSDLARDLAVSSRTVRHWAAGNTIPAPQWQKISDLCQTRAERLLLAVEAIAVVKA